MAQRIAATGDLRADMLKKKQSLKNPIDRILQSV